MSTKAIAATFGAFVAVGLLWAIAMPINAAPDEAQHMIWSASTARLQLEPTGPKAERTMKAPSVLYADYCFKFNPDQPADCVEQVDPAGDRHNRRVERAVPYYFAVGLASLATATEATGYLMRVAHVALTAAMLTLGVWSLSARPRTPGSIALVTIAFTPMVAFLTGTVNPSGLAIASGFAIWTGGLALAEPNRRTPRRIAAVAIPLVVYLVVRRDALVWAAPILAIVTLYDGPRRLVDAVRKPAVRAVLVVGGAIAAVGSLLAGGDVMLRIITDRPESYTGSPASEAFGILPRYTEAMIGRLGWLDVFLPDPVMVGWYALVAVAMLVSIGASRRDAIAATVVFGAVLLIPFLFGVVYNDRYVQGRYALPLAVGIPVIASAAAGSDRARHLVNARMARVITWTVAVLSAVSFAVAVRRFTVGHRQPWLDMLFDPAWTPPLPTTVLVGAYAAVMATAAAVLCRMIDRCVVDDSPQESPATP